MGEPGGEEKLYRGGESERLGGGKDKIVSFSLTFFFIFLFSLALRKVKTCEDDYRDFCIESISGECALFGNASTSAGITGQRHNEVVVGEALQRKL